MTQQPAHVIRRFLSTSLDFRLKRELSEFAQVDQDQQQQIIQLLGCAMLCGRRGKVEWFNNVPLNQVSALPVDVLGHRPGADIVEQWQFQLWLGLRAVAAVTGKPLAAPLTVVVKSLDLWRSNLDRTSTSPESAAHRVNKSMVLWLEGCSSGSEGLLQPSRYEDLRLI